MSTWETHEVYPPNFRLVVGSLPFPEGLYQLLKPPLLDIRVHTVLHKALHWNAMLLDHCEEAKLSFPDQTDGKNCFQNLSKVEFLNIEGDTSCNSISSDL